MLWLGLESDLHTAQLVNSLDKCVTIPKSSMELNNFYSSPGVIETDVLSVF